MGTGGFFHILLQQCILGAFDGLLGQSAHFDEQVMERRQFFVKSISHVSLSSLSRNGR